MVVGHGGDDVSQYCAVECHGKFEKYLKAMHDPGKALAHRFLDTHVVMTRLDPPALADLMLVPVSWRPMRAGCKW